MCSYIIITFGDLHCRLWSKYQCKGWDADGRTVYSSTNKDQARDKISSVSPGQPAARQRIFIGVVLC